jgi:hypothetical protein
MRTKKKNGCALEKEQSQDARPVTGASLRHRRRTWLGATNCARCARMFRACERDAESRMTLWCWPCRSEWWVVGGTPCTEEEKEKAKRRSRDF